MKKTVFFLCLLCLCCGAAAFAQEDARGRFAQAAAAYDRADLDEAIRLFQALADGEGGGNVEVWYNLGNSYYRTGRMGMAIWAYRCAQRLAPRDPDVQANLRFAAQAAGAPLPSPGFLEARLAWLSSAEWRWLFRMAYLGFFLAGILYFLLARVRGILLPMLVLLGGMTVLCGAVVLWGAREAKQPEWVVVDSAVHAVSAPLGAGTEIAVLPAGTIFRERGERADWLEIQREELRAWIPRTSAIQVR